MDNENIILDKTKAFALRTIKLYKYLVQEQKEFVLSKQILRCGTSIGANIAESECAISDKDFLSKIYKGSVKNLVAALYENKKLSSEDMSDLRKMFELE